MLGAEGQSLGLTFQERLTETEAQVYHQALAQYQLDNTRVGGMVTLAEETHASNLGEINELAARKTYAEQVADQEHAVVQRLRQDYAEVTQIASQEHSELQLMRQQNAEMSQQLQQNQIDAQNLQVQQHSAVQNLFTELQSQLDQANSRNETLAKQIHDRERSQQVASSLQDQGFEAKLAKLHNLFETKMKEKDDEFDQFRFAMQAQVDNLSTYQAQEEEEDDKIEQQKQPRIRTPN